MPLINCEVNIILTWFKHCVISNSTGEGKFAITEKKLYVPVVNVSTKDNTKLLQQLKSGFKKTISWNPTKKSFYHSGGIPVEFHWSHGKALENDWNKWNIWNSSEIPLEFQQFIILTPLKFHLSKIFVENWR